MVGSARPCCTLDSTLCRQRHRATPAVVNMRMKQHADDVDQLRLRVSALEALMAPGGNQSNVRTEAHHYIQNSVSMVIHQLKDSQSGVARCGWKTAVHIARGTAVVRDDISESPYWLICERCMPQLREQLMERNIDEEADPDFMSD